MSLQDPMLVPVAPATLQRRASDALKGAALGAVGLAPLVLLLGYLLDSLGLHYYPDVFAALILAALAALRALLTAFTGARRRGAQRAQLTAALHTQLAARGLSPDSTSSAARELRAAFWRDTQLEISRPLVALRVQLSGPRSLAEIAENIYESRALPLFGQSCLLSAVIVVSVLSLRGVDDESFVIVIGAMAGAAMAPLLFLFLIIATGLLKRISRAVAHQEIAREQRHIVALAGLIDSKGGLSLVDDDVRALLHGALSDAPNPGGQIELVAHPPREGGP